MPGTSLSGVLAGEFRELGAELEALAPALEAGEAEAAVRCIDLYHRVAQVAELLEAPPLRAFAEFLVANVPALGAGTGARRLTTWPELLGRCLERTEDAAAWGELTEWLTSPAWPVPLDEQQALELERQLKSLAALEDDGAGEPFPAIAADELSLTPGEDATPQAMEAFLREAPQQAAQLSRCLAALEHVPDAAERTAEACRLAHTLKGSAGILGVRIIAHLAHALEAALQSRAPEDWSGRPDALECLQEAGDMTELLIERTVSGGDVPADLIGFIERLRELSAVTAAAPAEPQPDHAAHADAVRPPDARIDPAPDEESHAQDLLAGPETAPRADALEPPRDRDGAAGAPDPAAAPAAGFDTFEASLAVPVRVIDDNLQRASELTVDVARLQSRLGDSLGRIAQLEERLQRVQTHVHELETFIDTRMTPTEARAAPRGGSDPVPPQFDPLELDQYNALHSIGGVLAEAVLDSRELTRGLKEDLGAHRNLLARHARSAKELGASITAARLVSVTTIVPRLERIARQTARQLGRKVELGVDHGGLSVDTEILDGLVEPLMHALRNAIDHGIEPREEREASGKPPAGRVDIAFRREGNRIEVVCKDDGRGLDVEAIAARARELGLIAPSASVADKDVIRHVFVTGLSTRRDATEISGRGIGMDSIRSAVERLKGTVQLDSRPGDGCTLTFRLPLSLSSTHVLFVRVDEAVYGLPSTAVERVVYSDTGELSFGSDATFSFESSTCPLHSLAALLGQTGRRLDELGTRPGPIVVVHGDTGPVALAVDRAVDSREVLIQPLGPTLPRLPGIAGGCVLPDGGISVVLEIGELLRTPVVSAPDDVARQRPQSPDVRCCALVVDDSLSARRALSELLGDSGYRVETAVDGLDAINRLTEVDPDIVLVDLEMPRMNGLELTSHLRSSEAWGSLPIVMITSRATAKHTQQAVAAGVSAYLTKPYSEDDLIDKLHDLVAP